MWALKICAAGASLLLYPINAAPVLPTQYPTPVPSVACGTCDGTLTLEVTTDEYPGEMTWALDSDTRRCSGDALSGSGSAWGLSPTSTITITESLCGDISYTWTIYDSYGDGICCAYGQGSYRLLVGGVVVQTSDGQYGSEESATFTSSFSNFSTDAGSNSAALDIVSADSRANQAAHSAALDIVSADSRADQNSAALDIISTDFRADDNTDADSSTVPRAVGGADSCAIRDKISNSGTDTRAVDGADTSSIGADSGTICDKPSNPSTNSGADDCADSSTICDKSSDSSTNFGADERSDDSAICDKISNSSTNFGADERSDSGADSSTICDKSSDSSTDFGADDGAYTSTIGADSGTICDKSSNSSTNSGADGRSDNGTDSSTICDKPSNSNTNSRADDSADSSAICDKPSNSSTDSCADDGADFSTIGADPAPSMTHLPTPEATPVPTDAPVEILIQEFSEHVISSSADTAISVFAIDMNHDGYVDVLSASVGDDKVRWFESSGGASPTFTEHVISSSVDGAHGVFAIDMNHDGNVDVLSASENDDKIRWFESSGGASPTFMEHVIFDDADYAAYVFAIDINHDGNVDVLSASRNDDKIRWFESSGGASPAFTEHVICSSADGARSIYAIDMNHDGNVDVLSASEYDDKIRWFESSGGASPTFTEHV
eukprot:CAMPEP_0171713056 /NCGR_PEP_ID=MMETSP0991-20121206/17520_1 /TAXON_ID=483369 /ORGANISM="non described non described, Strain CCMP2098" /LENGTH=667 /DNA_ID=CAMNT_0012303629 /DNA_START=366 /DNA_END=2365 /DNA_ORIENTATION=+